MISVKFVVKIDSTKNKADSGNFWDFGLQTGKVFDLDRNQIMTSL